LLELLVRSANGTSRPGPSTNHRQTPTQLGDEFSLTKNKEGAAEGLLVTLA
jgi:hypothetical protein